VIHGDVSGRWRIEFATLVSVDWTSDLPSGILCSQAVKQSIFWALPQAAENKVLTAVGLFIKNGI